ncbi:hypothetical protein KUTeg_009864 [Tegillarca granosa]|uniref:MLX-interacting protein n=1 Tax=Tegillarca granosa TaxID=220873 RepID=A0ABQ9F8D9_TEGGR|nr:hypothetical protein KUTeg_009864 [Tegillarca granosa]
MMAIGKNVTCAPQGKGSMSVLNTGNPSADQREENESTIHSGHFMLSNVHNPDVDDEDEDDVSVASDKDQAYDFKSACSETTETYKFGRVAIDASLTKLFQCMTLAYSGKLTSPKWKPFRGLHLTVKDKVRLNNLIWREWHMQYIYQRSPVVCLFATPLSDDIHTKPEAIVLEGKYWKRRLDTVTAEYKRWRKYFKARRSFCPLDFDMMETSSHEDLLQRVGEVRSLAHDQPSFSTDLLLNATDFMDMDLSDNFFNSLNQASFAFPNPRELSGLGMADIMQPGLVSLQPNLDDFMDTYDPIQEVLQSSRALANTCNNQNDLSVLGDIDMRASPGPPPPMAAAAAAPSTVVADSSSTQATNISAILALLSGDPNAIVVDPQNPNATTQLLSQILQQQIQPQQQQLQQQQQQTTSTFFLPNGQQSSRSNSLPETGISVQRSNTPTSVNRQASTPVMSSLQAALLSPSPLVSQKSTNQKTQNINKSSSAPALPSGGHKKQSSQQLVKKDGFVVPQRTIAPAPSSTSRNTQPSTASAASSTPSLERLLKTGKYDGAIINVKKEPVLPKLATSTSAPPLFTPVTPIRPAPDARTQTTTVSTVTPVMVPSATLAFNLQPVVSDFSASFFTLATPASTSVNNNSLTTPKETQPKLNKQISSKPSQLVSVLNSSPSSISSIISPSLPTQISSPPRDVKTSFISTQLSSPESPISYDAVSPQSKTEGKGEHRREMHISAEHKRRCNIKVKEMLGKQISHVGCVKNGFDVLHTIIPALSQNPNAKISKAAMLQKKIFFNLRNVILTSNECAAEYCKKLKSERSQMQDEAEILKQEIESLNNEISQCQQQLPATGVPVTRQRADRMKDMFEEYVKTRTLQNWKFWILF